MPRPKANDADILLRLVEIMHTDRMDRALKWFWGDFAPKELKEYGSFYARYPFGSEGFIHYTVVSAFWETAGVLIKHRLLSQDLFFDRFLVNPYWERLRFVIEGDRKETKDASIAENFEWLYNRAKRWRQRRVKAVKRH